jgi:Flp pilus assembly protein TadD
MKSLPRVALLFCFNVFAGNAIAADLQTAAVAPAKNDLVARMSQAVQSQDWYQSEKLASAAIGAGGLSVNEKAAALNNLCVSLALKRMYTQGVDVCSQSVALTPDRPGPYINRGNIYAKMGKESLAREDYAKAKALDPNSDLSERNISSMRWKEDLHYVALVANY